MKYVGWNSFPFEWGIMNDILEQFAAILVDSGDGRRIHTPSKAFFLPASDINPDDDVCIGKRFGQHIGNIAKFTEHAQGNIAEGIAVVHRRVGDNLTGQISPDCDRFEVVIHTPVRLILTGCVFAIWKKRKND